jgi:hypothetical protein
MNGATARGWSHQARRTASTRACVRAAPGARDPHPSSRQTDSAASGVAEGHGGGGPSTSYSPYGTRSGGSSSAW